MQYQLRSAIVKIECLVSTYKKRCIRMVTHTSKLLTMVIDSIVSHYLSILSKCFNITALTLTK